MHDTALAGARLQGFADPAARRDFTWRPVRSADFRDIAAS